MPATASHEVGQGGGPAPPALPILLIPLLQLVHAEGVAGHAGAHLQAHRAACASVC